MAFFCGDLNNMLENWNNGMQITYFNRICETFMGYTSSPLKKNKIYYESVWLNIANA